jgi:hypothetical protein
MKNINSLMVNRLFSMRTMITSRAYYSAIMNVVTNEFIMDTPYNFFSYIHEMNTVEPSKIIHQIDSVFLWGMAAYVCWNFMMNEPKDKARELYTFVDYNAIDRDIKIILFTFIFVFGKNIESAI